MQGFTLLEILVALAILGVAVNLVLQLFSSNLRAISTSSAVISAAAKGESRIREILAEDSLLEKSWSEITEDGYRLDVSISEVLKERTENLPVKLMEVALIVRWSERLKEKSFTVRSLKMVEKVKMKEQSTPVPAPA